MSVVWLRGKVRGFELWGFVGCWDEVIGLRAQGFQDEGYRVQGSRFRVQDMKWLGSQ